MWVLPKNYQLSSAFAQDMLESKGDLILLESSIESSLMWKSKPSPLQIWLRKWNQVSWIPPLFGRILKPSHQKSFQEKLTSLLADTHANPFHRLEKEKALKMNGTFGHISENIFKPSSQTDAFLKTSKATFRLDSPQSSVIWKKMVLEQRGAYSQRVKLAHHTKESGSLSWPTPTVSDIKGPRGAEAQRKKGNPSDSLPNIMKNLYPDSHPDQTNSNTIGSVQEHSPDWVEQLMGIPTGLTDLNCLEME